LQMILQNSWYSKCNTYLAFRHFTYSTAFTNCKIFSQHICNLLLLHGGTKSNFMLCKYTIKQNDFYYIKYMQWLCLFLSKKYFNLCLQQKHTWVCQATQLVFQLGTRQIQSTSLTHLIAIHVHPSDIALMF
jgi:hypothetical protein